MIWSDSLYWLNKRAIFHNEFCNFKQYKNKDSGKCKPCPENSYSIDGQFSSSCIEKRNPSTWEYRKRKVLQSRISEQAHNCSK